jgi:hypothetical protein
VNEPVSLVDLLDWLRYKLWPSEHFQQRIISGVTPAVAGDDIVIRHDLNRTLAGTGPNGNEQGAEFIYWLDGAGTLYEGDRADWTPNSFTLRCTDASRGFTVIVR